MSSYEKNSSNTVNKNNIKNELGSKTTRPIRDAKSKPI